MSYSESILNYEHVIDALAQLDANEQIDDILDKLDECERIQSEMLLLKPDKISTSDEEKIKEIVSKIEVIEKNIFNISKKISLELESTQREKLNYNKQKLSLTRTKMFENGSRGQYFDTKK